MNKCLSSKSCRINFRPNNNFSSKCCRNCFIAGSLLSIKMSDIKDQAAKCKKMMGIFEEGEEGFYNIKDLEKLSKSKGIATNEVKIILESLVSDEKLESDKIGSTLFYWSFPEKKIEADKKISDELKWKNKELNDKLVALTATLKKQEEAKEKVTDYEKTRREELMKNIKELKVKERDLIDYLNNDDNTSVDDINKLSTGVQVSEIIQYLILLDLKINYKTGTDYCS
ncbi:unnamed protein product [Chironomus riparius]|uniref:Mnd1 HTH domain-containing protein n=1 Tax=Chironomus riparius TaxID=315576 RepID=A0A9P0IK46_9DIPT|nr:unnamed protein product [Chironomus riparius]